MQSQFTIMRYQSCLGLDLRDNGPTVKRARYITVTQGVYEVREKSGILFFLEKSGESRGI